MYEESFANSVNKILNPNYNQSNPYEPLRWSEEKDISKQKEIGKNFGEIKKTLTVCYEIYIKKKI